MGIMPKVNFSFCILNEKHGKTQTSGRTMTMTNDKQSASWDSVIVQKPDIYMNGLLTKDDIKSLVLCKHWLKLKVCKQHF